MFIDNIKYPAAMLVALFSLFFVVGCGSAESEAKAESNPVPLILDRLSGSACDELPYEGCLTAAVSASYELQHTQYTELETDPESADFHLHRNTPEQISEIRILFQRNSLEEIWWELQRKHSEGNKSHLSWFVKRLVEMILVTQELDQTLTHIDIGKLLEYEQTAAGRQAVSEAREKCSQSLQHGFGIGYEVLNLCSYFRANESSSVEAVDTDVALAEIRYVLREHLAYLWKSVDQMQSLTRRYLNQ